MLGVMAEPQTGVSGTSATSDDNVASLIAALRGTGRTNLVLRDLRPLAQESIRVRVSDTVAQVIQHMRGSDATAALAYESDETDACATHMITLSALEREMATPFGQPLFLNRPLAYLLARHPLNTPTFPDTTSLADACDAALARPRVSRQDPVISRDESGEFTVLPIQSLLLAQLEAHRASLGEITAATRARESLQNELVAASRMAGMAEIATDVLHNVGNVLNSVSVSLSIIQDDLSATRLGGLERAATLLDSERSNLPAFFSSDRGPALVDYVVGLSAQLAQEQRKLGGEISAIAQSLEHIKATIAAQQRHASGAPLWEEVTAKALCSDVLTIKFGALQRHAISVVQEHEDLPAFVTDRHLALQALINVMHNAKQSIDAAAPPIRQITLRSFAKLTPTGRHAVISVTDTGQGIDAANLQRVFSHGFTTRPDGHGFGLHSAATSLQKLGGSITASSDGRGCGATFMISFPLEAGTERNVQPGVQAA